MASRNAEDRTGSTPEHCSRYPGVQPFGDGEIHRRLFRGRDEEKYELLQLVLAERLVLLFARSGIGKSSLINAGLLEPLRGKGYFPMVVRVSGASGSPIDSLYQGIEAAAARAAERGQIEFEPPAAAWNRTSLWHFFKTFELWQNDRLLMPVLVIDQFEELFTLHAVEQRRQFIHELADLIRGTRPRNRLQGDGPRLSDTPPEIKVVLALREDFYANLEELRNRIPSIYKAPFRLNPLSRDQARRAIVEPAALEGEYFSTPTFSWSEEALDKVLDFLSEQQLGEGKTKVGKEVEPFQLQLICQHVEQQVRRNKLETVRADDLGGAEALKAILSSFYEDSLQKICARFPGEPDLRKRLERLCEYGFITAKGRRLLREESTIKQDDGVGPEVLTELVELRVLRKEPRVGDNYYELTHDTLIEPIQLSRQAREQRKARQAQNKARKRLLAAGVAATVVLVAFGAWALLERAETYRVTQAKQQALAAQQRAEQEAQRAAVEAERALAAKRQALVEKQRSVEVAVKAKLEAGEEGARRQLAEAKAELAAVEPLAIAAQKKLAESKLQAIEAKGRDYEAEAKRLVTDAEDALQEVGLQVEAAQKEVFEAKTRVTLTEARREDTKVKLAASGNAAGVEENQAAQTAVEVEAALTESKQQAKALKSRLTGAASPQAPLAAIAVEDSNGEEKTEPQVMAKVYLAALEFRESETKSTDTELVGQYQQLLKASGGELSADELQKIEHKIRELEQSSEKFAELKRKDDDPNFSFCEALDQWSAYQPRRALGPEAQYRDLRLAELNALFQDTAVVSTQANFITSNREDGRDLKETFALRKDRVYIHAWINSPRSQAVRLVLKDGASQQTIWKGKRVERNPLRGPRLGYHLWTWQGAKKVGAYELLLYNAKNKLICRREFKIEALSP